MEIKVFIYLLERSLCRVDAVGRRGEGGGFRCLPLSLIHELWKFVFEWLVCGGLFTASAHAGDRIRVIF